MGHKTLLSFLVASITSLALFIGIDSAHTWVSAQSTPHKGMSECQSICPPLLNEKQKTPQLENDEAKPDPLPLQLKVPALYLNTLYAVVFSALIWQYLQRRPPDILKLQSAYLL